MADIKSLDANDGFKEEKQTALAKYKMQELLHYVAAPVKSVGKISSEFVEISQKYPFPKASCECRTFLLSHTVPGGKTEQFLYRQLGYEN